MRVITKIMFLAVVIVFLPTGCGKWETKATWDLPDKSNLQKWARLKVRQVEPDEPLATTDTRPSNVSPDMALTSALQGLQNYTGKFNHPLNTAFTVKRMNDNVVGDEYYYVGLCEFDRNKPNGATIKQLKGIIPAIAVVNARNESEPAVIRTANAKGEPYKIKIHWESLKATGRDDYDIIEWLDDHGFPNRKAICNEITAPKLEFDDIWNPYITVVYLEDDGCSGQIGTAWYPVAFGIVDIQKATMVTYAMDNPFTQDINEGENPKSGYKKQSEIPTWVDWVYSRRMFIQMATHNGFNMDNYGKRSVYGDLILDGSRVNDNIEVVDYSKVIIDISLARDNQDLIMVAYRTSRSNDMAMNSILTMNARTGECVERDVKGGLAVKSLAIEIIEEAGLLRGEYHVQDLTLHEIFGQLTWEGVLVRDVLDNEGNDGSQSGDSESVYSERALDYSVYAGTVWMPATNALQPADIVWHTDYEVSMSKYRDHLYRQGGRRGLSKVLEDKIIENGIVESKSVIGDEVVLRIKDHNLTFIVEVKTAHDRQVGDAASVNKGDRVYMIYGDQKNSSTAPVRVVRRR